MEEVWKPVNGFEGWYEVSNYGRVRSVDRIISQYSRYGHNINRTIKGKLITPIDNGNGYLIVGLRKNQVRVNHYVHRLVAEAFIENPNGFPVVNHLDFNKSNNIFSNLEWTSHLNNVRYSAANMLKPHKNKLSKSGEKYITKRGRRWRVNITRKGFTYDRTFGTIEEAIAVREVILNGVQYLAD